MTPNQAARTTLCTTLLAATLVSCGGDSGAFDNGVDMTGHYAGTVTLGGVPYSESRMLVDGEGHFVLNSWPYLLVGDIRTSDNTFTAKADAFSFEPGFANGSNSTVSGSKSGTLVSGTFTGGSLSGSVSLGNSTAGSIPTSIDAFTGSHSGFMNLGHANYYDAGTITVLSDGTFTADYGGGCIVEGQLSVRVVDGNLYGFTATLEGCGANGTVRGGLGYQSFDGELILYGRLGNVPVRIYLNSAG